jgi:hypothetical protein
MSFLFRNPPRTLSILRPAHFIEIFVLAAGKEGKDEIEPQLIAGSEKRNTIREAIESVQFEADPTRHIVAMVQAFRGGASLGLLWGPACVLPFLLSKGKARPCKPFCS